MRLIDTSPRGLIGLLLLCAPALLSACSSGAEGLGADIPEEVGTTATSFEDFLATVYQEPETGVYIVNGDTPVETLEQLYQFWEQHVRQDALAVNRVGGADDRWSDAQKITLLYCVSTSFGARYQSVVDAMATATAAWEQVANVHFIHVESEDPSCTGSDGYVEFDVRPTAGKPYLARAFFPSSSRGNRNILIDNTSFGAIGAFTLAGILRHEVGHTLGFRHEHTRPEAGACFEDNDWRALTPYDSASVMHYPQCNGTNAGDLVLTARDAQGAQSLYGAAPTGRKCVMIRRGAGGQVEDSPFHQDSSWLTGSYNSLTTGRADDGHALRSLLRFSVDGIPDGATITGATLGLAVAWNTTPGSVNIHPITKPWSESTITSRDFGNGFSPQVVTSLNPTGNGMKYADLTQLTQGWLDGQNQGILLEEDAAPAGTNHGFRASENATVAAHPMLEVCFVPGQGGNSALCPEAPPEPESGPCVEGLGCTYGLACCGGQCSPSFGCGCSGGIWVCANTDACL